MKSCKTLKSLILYWKTSSKFVLIFRIFLTEMLKSMVKIDWKFLKVLQLIVASFLIKKVFHRSLYYWRDGHSIVSLLIKCVSNECKAYSWVDRKAFGKAFNQEKDQNFLIMYSQWTNVYQNQIKTLLIGISKEKKTYIICIIYGSQTFLYTHTLFQFFSEHVQ